MNTFEPIFFSFEPMVKFDSFVQLTNINSPITVPLMVTFFNAVQSRKAYFPISVTESRITRLSIAVPQNALPEMLVTFDGIAIFVKPHTSPI